MLKISVILFVMCLGAFASADDRCPPVIAPQLVVGTESYVAVTKKAQEVCEENLGPAACAVAVINDETGWHVQCIVLEDEQPERESPPEGE